MKLDFLGHACFKLTLDNGRKIIFDPYDADSYDEAFSYGPIEGDYDIAVISHSHADHRSENVISGIKDIVDSEGEFFFGDVEIKMVPTFHDEFKGSKRGGNLISIVKSGPISVAHLGDLGHVISPEEIPELESVDVMLIPVGGYFTIDAGTAHKIAGEFNPSIVIPMHFKTEKVMFPIESVDRFLELEDNVERFDGSSLDITDDILGGKRRTIALNPAL